MLKTKEKFYFLANDKAMDLDLVVLTKLDDTLESAFPVIWKKSETFFFLVALFKRGKQGTNQNQKNLHLIVC